MTDQRVFLASELAVQLGGELVGDDRTITGIGTLSSADQNQLSFLSNPKYASELLESSAGVVLVTDVPTAREGSSFLKVADPYKAYAQASRLFSKLPDLNPGIHPAASVADGASVAETAQVCAGAVICAGATVLDQAYIGAGSVVGEFAVVGANTRLEANVSIYPHVRVGQACIIHSGAVIGADGFGFAATDEGWLKIEQLGSVVIEDDVEVGANTTIDRGAINDTVIEKGVKLDNQIQIAHNVRIGEGSAIAGGTCIAGSTRIGKHCTIAGMSGVTGHLNIADGTHITAMTLVSRSIDKAGAYSSGTGMETHRQWKKNVVRFRQLDQLARKVKVLEEEVRQLSVKESK